MTQTVYIQRLPSGYSNHALIDSAILQFPEGKRLEVVVRPLSTRSERQNKYFHACVDIMAKTWGYTKDEMKSIIKCKFLSREKVHEETGEILPYIEETHKLSKEDFFEMQTHLIQWAAQLGIVLPFPGEELQINFSE